MFNLAFGQGGEKEGGSHSSVRRHLGRIRSPSAKLHTHLLCQLFFHSLTCHTAPTVPHGEQSAFTVHSARKKTIIEQVVLMFEKFFITAIVRHATKHGRIRNVPLPVNNDLRLQVQATMRFVCVCVLVSFCAVLFNGTHAVRTLLP